MKIQIRKFRTENNLKSKPLEYAWVKNKIFFSLSRDNFNGVPEKVTIPYILCTSECLCQTVWKLYIEYTINVKILSVVCQIRELPDDKLCVVKGNGKALPLQAWSGPESSRKLRFPHFMTTAQDSGKVVSLTHRPPLTSGNTRGTHFC